MMKLTIQTLIFPIALSVFGYSCGEHTSTETKAQNDSLRAISANSTAIVNVNIIEFGAGWNWDFGQTQRTIYGKINSVLKGDLKTSDTLAFSLTQSSDSGDTIQVKKNGNYILFLKEITGKAQFGQKQDTSKAAKSADIKFSTQKWFPTYVLTDEKTGIIEYNASLEDQIKKALNSEATH